MKRVGPDEYEVTGKFCRIVGNEILLCPDCSDRVTISPVVQYHGSKVPVKYMSNEDMPHQDQHKNVLTKTTGAVASINKPSLNDFLAG